MDTFILLERRLATTMELLRVGQGGLQWMLCLLILDGTDTSIYSLPRVSYTYTIYRKITPNGTLIWSAPTGDILWTNIPTRVAGGVP